MARKDLQACKAKGQCKSALYNTPLMLDGSQLIEVPASLISCCDKALISGCNVENTMIAP